MDREHMLTPVPPTRCVRARESVSAQLDGELSELEALRLELHLRRCGACLAWAEEVRAATARVRATALEQPSAPITLPLRAARRRVPALAGAAAAVAAAAAAIVVGSFGPPASRPAQSSSGSVPRGPHSLALEERLLAFAGPANLPTTAQDDGTIQAL
jgi:anti-sigma factor RsiW